MSADPNHVALSADERINRLEQQIADNQQQTQQQIAEVLKLLKQPTPTNAPATPIESNPSPELIPSFVSRRSMLKKAALATLGAAAVWETMPSAKAANGDNLILGQTNSSKYTTSLSSFNAGTTLEVFNSGYNGVDGSTDIGYGVKGTATTGGGVYGNSGSGAGVAGTSTTGSGVFGISTSGSGTSSGVYGKSSASNGTGVYGNASVGDDSYGVWGVSTSGFGVVGRSSSNSGVYGISTSNSGVYGISSSNSGVRGISTSGSGVYGQSSTSVGLYGEGLYGALLQGTVAPLFLNASALSTPYADTNGHFPGELYVDSSFGLWYCTVGGTPGTWNRLAASVPSESTSAGSFALLSAPTRFIDTRPSSASYTPDALPLTATELATYGFSGTNALTPYSSGGGTLPSIPYGATALAGRITVLNGQNGHSTTSGELKVSNVLPPGFGSGLIIWGSTPASQILPFVLGLNNTDSPGTGVMYFENTSSADTIDLIVDVTGYYY